MATPTTYKYYKKQVNNQWYPERLPANISVAGTGLIEISPEKFREVAQFWLDRPYSLWQNATPAQKEEMKRTGNTSFLDSGNIKVYQGWIDEIGKPTGLVETPGGGNVTPEQARQQEAEAEARRTGIAPPGTIAVKTSTGATVFAPAGSPAALLQEDPAAYAVKYGSASDIQSRTLAAGGITPIQALSGQIVKSATNPTIYLIKDGVRHPIQEMNQLYALGFKDSDIQIKDQSWIQGFQAGGYITPENIGTFQQRWGISPTTGGTSFTTPPTGKKFQESDAYKALSAEEKEIADLLFNVISVGGEAEATTFANAIQQSIAIAEPWAKAQAAMALAEFAGAVDETIFGFAAKTEAIQRARDILAEDVSMQKEFLTLEQQSEVARQVSKYDEDLLSIADQAAEKGITFATGARSRVLAEERRAEQFQDVIQSSRRKTNFQIKELELKAARGDVEAQKQLEALSGEQGFALRKIGRSAEEILGSERARELGVTGFQPVGGVAGALEEEKEKRIISDVGGIVGLTDLLTT